MHTSLLKTLPVLWHIKPLSKIAFIFISLHPCDNSSPIMCGGKGEDPWEAQGNIPSPCPAEGLNISTWWNSKDGTAASSHRGTQGSCKDRSAGCMLRGLKSVTWQLLPQHAPSFEGKSSKHTHTLGFDYLFFEVNKLKKTNLMLWGDQMLWLHCTAFHHINEHSGRKEWLAAASRVPEVDGNGSHLVSGCLWQFADEQREGLCWESWSPLLTWEEMYSTAPIPSEHLGSGLCNHKELWRKLNV